MLELIGVLGGGLVRLLPVVLDFFKKKEDNAQELRLLDRNIELEKQRGMNREAEIREMTIQGQEQGWTSALIEAVKNATPPLLEDKGSWWINLLNGLNTSVRPILTYWWCIVIYTANKIILSVVAIQEKTRLAEMAPIIYTDFDRAVVGSIIGFWFVDRALRHDGKKP